MVGVGVALEDEVAVPSKRLDDDVNAESDIGSEFVVDLSQRSVSLLVIPARKAEDGDG